jgi:hypothetical protein
VREEIFFIMVSPRRAAIPKLLLRPCRNLASFSGVPWDQCAVHGSIPTCRRSWLGMDPRQTKENPCESREQLRGRPTVQQPVRPHLRSRESSDGVKTSAGRKRPPGRNSTNDAARQLPRRKRRWKKREREHHKWVATIEGARDALEKKLQAEDARWAEEKDELERALRGARIGPRRLCPLADVKRLGRPG